MKRILVLGSGGSGKTTLSIKLAAKTGLRLYHLDVLYWQPGWAEPPREIWRKKVADIAAQETWIIEGSYVSSLDLRVPRADLIILLDIPNWRCIWNVMQRWVKYAPFTHRPRPGMAPGCQEKVDFKFLYWVWEYPRKDKVRAFEMIEKFKNPTTNVLIFKSYRTMEAFLASISGAGNQAHS